jgi:hypothetical protein
MSTAVASSSAGSTAARRAPAASCRCASASPAAGGWGPGCVRPRAGAGRSTLRGPAAGGSWPSSPPAAQQPAAPFQHAQPGACSAAAHLPAPPPPPRPPASVACPARAQGCGRSCRASGPPAPKAGGARRPRGASALQAGAPRQQEHRPAHRQPEHSSALKQLQLRYRLLPPPAHLLPVACGHLQSGDHLRREVPQRQRAHHAAVRQLQQVWAGGGRLHSSQAQRLQLRQRRRGLRGRAAGGGSAGGGRAPRAAAAAAAAPWGRTTCRQRTTAPHSRTGPHGTPSMPVPLPRLDTRAAAPPAAARRAAPAGGRTASHPPPCSAP